LTQKLEKCALFGHPEIKKLPKHEILKIEKWLNMKKGQYKGYSFSKLGPQMPLFCDYYGHTDMGVVGPFIIRLF